MIFSHKRQFWQLRRAFQFQFGLAHRNIQAFLFQGGVSPIGHALPRIPGRQRRRWTLFKSTAIEHIGQSVHAKRRDKLVACDVAGIRSLDQSQSHLFLLQFITGDVVGQRRSLLATLTRLVNQLTGEFCIRLVNTLTVLQMMELQVKPHQCKAHILLHLAFGKPRHLCALLRDFNTRRYRPAGINHLRSLQGIVVAPMRHRSGSALTEMTVPQAGVAIIAIRCLRRNIRQAFGLSSLNSGLRLARSRLKALQTRIMGLGSFKKMLQMWLHAVLRPCALRNSTDRGGKHQACHPHSKKMRLNHGL